MISHAPPSIILVDLLEKKKLVQQFLGLPSTKSFVLSEKLFGKLSAEDEQEPFVHLIVYLLSVTEHYELVASVDVLAFASAVMYCTIQSSLHVTRHKACKFLEELVQQSSELVRRVCGIVIIGLNNIKIPETAPVAVEDRLTWAIGPIQCSSDYGTRLYSLIQTITPSSKMLQEHPTIDRLVVEECVTDFVMLTSDSRITSIFGNDAWIRLCFRAGLDPRAVVEKYTPILFSKWFAKKAVGEEWEYDLSESGISESILSVISLFSSVAPRLVISELFDWIKTVLHANMVSSITQLDIDVWKTPEGELNTDPIKQLQKGQAPRAKASSAIAGAKSGGAGGSSSKPSKAEKELINQQLEKESAIRSRVQRVYNTVSSGLRILKSVLEGLRVSLADDARSAIQNYMGQFVNQVLLNVIVRECVKIPESPSIVMFRPLAIDVFVTLGRIAGYRLESLIVPRPVLAMNVLRLVGAPEGSDGVPKMYCNASVAGK